MKSHLNSQSGSALIQAMLGLGLVGMMSYAVMNYQAYSNQENRAQFAQNEIDSTAQMVSALVAIPALCNSNVSLQNNFVRPANLNNPAADAPLAINLGLPTSARPAWVDGTMGAAASTSIPGTITDFNIQVHSIFVSGARLKRNVSATNQLWVGDIVLTAQKPRLNPNDGLPTTGKRIVGTIELEIDAAGTKVNCSTSASVATICRDLGGVYDPLGVPNCVFAMKPMDCDSLPDGYVHDIDGSGNPVCRSATAICPTGYFANGMTEGALNCTRLTRKILYQLPSTPPPSTPSCLANDSVAGALYGTCVGAPSNIAEINASCCSGTTYAICDASSDKIYYCGTAAPPSPPPPPPPTVPPTSLTEVRTYLNEPYNPNFPRCSGSAIETMGAGLILGPPPTFTIETFDPPIPSGANCVSALMSGTYPATTMTWAFFTGPAIIGSYNPAMAVGTYTGGACKPTGTLIPLEAKSCTGPGTTAFCCNSSYTCNLSTNQITCN